MHDHGGFSGGDSGGSHHSSSDSGGSHHSSHHGTSGGHHGHSGYSQDHRHSGHHGGQPGGFEPGYLSEAVGDYGSTADRRPSRGPSAAAAIIVAAIIMIAFVIGVVSLMNHGAPQP